MEVKGSGGPALQSALPVPSRDRWTAWLLSLLLPGAGQLWARSRWGVPWLAAAALIVLGSLLGLREGPASVPAQPFQAIAAAAIALLSAEHARRLLEGGAGRRAEDGIRARIACAPPRGAAVHLRIEVETPFPAADLWRWIADLPRFLCIDPFHTRVIPMRPRLEPGVDIAIEHTAFGFRFYRFGRLLRLKDGRSYSFSDLSTRGPRRGFPHVFTVAVEEGAPGGGGSRLAVAVRGKWTARRAPRFLARWWLLHVCREHARLLERSLRAAARAGKIAAR